MIRHEGISKFLIYALVDPRIEPGQIFYIGKSSRGLYRPYDHARPYSLKRSSHKNDRILDIKKAGREYDVWILEELPAKDNLDERETHWILEYLDYGAPLTNIKFGGGRGGQKMNHTDEARKKMSEARKKLCKPMTQRGPPKVKPLLPLSAIPRSTIRAPKPLEDLLAEVDRAFIAENVKTKS